MFYPPLGVDRSGDRSASLSKFVARQNEWVHQVVLKLNMHVQQQNTRALPTRTHNTGQNGRSSRAQVRHVWHTVRVLDNTVGEGDLENSYRLDCPKSNLAATHLTVFSPHSHSLPNLANIDHNQKHQDPLPLRYTAVYYPRVIFLFSV